MKAKNQKRGSEGTEHLPLRSIRFVGIALLLLALISAGQTPVSAQGLGPIAYDKPNRLGDFDLWTIQPDGTGDTWVPITYRPGVCDRCPLLGAQHPAWSRNGQLIAVTGLIGGQGFEHLAGGYGMVVFEPSTGRLTPLAALGTAHGGGPAAFSPDGTQLAFTDPGPGFHQYRVINLDRSNPRNITQVLGEQVPYPGLDWSPTDANTLVVSMFDRSLDNVQGNTQLAFVPPIEGGILAARPLTRPPHSLQYQIFDANPAFSRNGRFVAFSRFIKDVVGVSWTEIRVIDVTNPGDLQGRLLLSLPAGEFISNLSWSPDGSRLVFDRQKQFENLGLWIYNGSSMVPLQGPPARNPAWGWAFPVSQTPFAQFANGASFVSRLVLTNPSRTEAASGSVSFFNDQGQPLLVPINRQPPNSRVPFIIQPLGHITLTTDGMGNLVSGAARVTANIPVGGVVQFSFPGLGIAGVGESVPLAALMTPVVRDAGHGLSTSIAMHNMQAREAEFRLSLRGLDGREVTGGSALQRLPANGHSAKFIEELFPGANTANFQGTLIVTTTTPGGRMAAMAIQLGRSTGEFTTLPVVAIDPAPTARELFFAQFANGSGFISSLFLTNPLSAPVRDTLSFFDGAGNRLAISVNNQPPSNRVPFTIAPEGGAVFTTGGQGELISGSARVTADGPIGGVLRFAFPSLGIAGVGASVPTSAFITPAVRSTASGLRTGVAITTIGPAVTLRLTLRSQRGEPVAGGQATLSLPAGGHLARFIEELFPDSDTREFEGTLTVTAEGGSVAATAIRLGSRAGEFTTLPVTALR